MSVVKRNLVQLYYDTVSPWSFIGYEIIKRYQKRWDCDLELVPVNLGYVMGYSGNRPPISVPNKGKYMWDEIERAQKFFGLPLSTPTSFPVNTQTLQQHLDLVAQSSPSLLTPLTEIYFRAVWQRNLPCKTVEEVLHILDTDDAAKGLWKSDHDRRESVEQATSKEAKERGKTLAKRIVEEEGVFGMPWFNVTRARDGQRMQFFGSDRFEQMAAFLEKPYAGPHADGRLSKL
ncbi:uncharacterized protein PFL1_04845 [Pseudozyma flocculosa PF-1]|uniref:Glutathione S-transferase kappa n=2 Tax=Pseudozyma flocculosa TaxID=84751 RepID=A0A5C3F4A2_9BASI|nr:uncharacterized protein PFL1_04845 [Pseudozyma flocculosa PF-1]EPQ27707.1 hypothetical protein PFL1_04845 [Pseudozyma flocculosa PF-1]SPO39152.1 related to Glutathione S-transferase, mitochondrial [Pseudozyma flocculosa]